MGLHRGAGIIALRLRKIVRTDGGWRANKRGKPFFVFPLPRTFHEKIHSFALVAVAALALTACGGGGGDDAPSANPGTGTGTGTGSGGVAGTPTAPVTTTFTGHHYLQNLGSPGTTTNFRDIGVGAEGTLTYGAQGKVVSMTPQADGNVAMVPTSPPVWPWETTCLPTTCPPSPCCAGSDSGI